MVFLKNFIIVIFKKNLTAMLVKNGGSMSLVPFKNLKYEIKILRIIPFILLYKIYIFQDKITLTIKAWNYKFRDFKKWDTNLNYIFDNNFYI